MLNSIQLNEDEYEYEYNDNNLIIPMKEQSGEIQLYLKPDNGDSLLTYAIACSNSQYEVISRLNINIALTK